MRFLGIDLAWGEGSEQRPANRSGVVALETTGKILEAGWTSELDETIEWVERCADSTGTVLFIDAPLVIANAAGQRLCEREVGQRYGRWWVSANSTNLSSPRRAGVALRKRLEERGWRYESGIDGPASTGLVMYECYPYATIVGAHELGYEDRRPPYKRLRKGVPAAQAWKEKTAACDELIERVAALDGAEVPMDLRSHERTRELIEVPSPTSAKAYKKREDLLDAAICAWTAALWQRHGLERCQVLGAGEEPDDGGRVASIIAPWRRIAVAEDVKS